MSFLATIQDIITSSLHSVHTQCLNTAKSVITANLAVTAPITNKRTILCHGRVVEYVVVTVSAIVSSALSFFESPYSV